MKHFISSCLSAMAFITQGGALILLLFGLAVLPLEASHKKVGTSAAQFLKIGVGARPMGLAGACSALIDDAQAAYWNPAGLVRIGQPEIAAMHLKYFQDINYEFISYVQPGIAGGVAAISGYYLTTGGIEERSEDTWDPLGKFKFNDTAISLSYARPLNGWLLGGITAKCIEERIASEKAATWATDLGFLSRTPLDNLLFALVVQNLGPKLEYLKDGDPLPRNYKIGLGYSLFHQRLNCGLDVNYPRDNYPNIAVGTEYRIILAKDWGFTLRSGYRSGSDLGALAGLSVGGGINFRSYRLDFVWVPAGELGDTLRFSFLFNF